MSDAEATRLRRNEASKRSMAKRAAADPLLQTRLQEKFKHGWTLEERAAFIAAHGGKCGVCRKTDSGRRDWNVDHDHSCCPQSKSCRRCRRGILCDSCNRGLGFFQDSRELLAAAIHYLDRPIG